MTEADIGLITRQYERILTEIGTLRDDNAVLTAIMTRLDGSVSALSAEMRAVHNQIARMNDRIRKLEDAE